MLARFQQTDGKTAGCRTWNDEHAPPHIFAHFPVYSPYAMQDLALIELANFLKSEIVEKVPLAKYFLPESWVPDRVNAAKVSFSPRCL